MMIKKYLIYLKSLLNKKIKKFWIKLFTKKYIVYVLLSNHKSWIWTIKKKNLFLNNFPDNKSDTIPILDIIKWCEDIINKIKPDVIFTHHRGCTNIDHRRLHEAVVVATRPNPRNKVSVISAEILSSTGYLKPINFEPNFHIKISKKDLDTKIKAMNTYSTEKRSSPHPRSSDVIKSLSILRGSYSGNEYAESFLIENLLI